MNSPVPAKAPIRHYCSYTHHNYLPRALVLLDSLREHGGPFKIHLLCLSDECAAILEEMAIPEIRIIRLAELEHAYPEILGVKEERWPAEYFFTLTPYLITHSAATTPGIDIITYIDVDLCFYSSPEQIFSAMGTASIAITPHRYAPEFLVEGPTNCLKFGLYNVGWITYRLNEVGRRCLEDYRRDCLDWCYDKPENGRYADQGYLDAWPNRYIDVYAIPSAGVNVAPWNVANHLIHIDGDQFYSGSEPLIFYHFHGIRGRADGGFEVNYPTGVAAPGTVLRDQLYEPYLMALQQRRVELADHFPSVDWNQALRKAHTMIGAIVDDLIAGVDDRGSVAVFGVGDIGSAFIDAARRADIETIACTDSNDATYGTTVSGVPVISWAGIQSMGCKTIVVASVKYRDEIAAFIRSKDPEGLMTIITSSNR